MTDHAAAKRLIDGLLAELRGIFGARLHSLVIYGRHAVQPTPDADDPRSTGAPPDAVHTLALVESLTFDDLEGCARLAPGWTRRGLAIPLMLTRDEFTRSLDAFPLEYGGIIAQHRVVFGENPFASARVLTEDLRRACEVQVKSHLVHLREAYVEAGAQPALVARVIAASAPPFRGLLANLARLQGAAVDDTEELVRHAESAGLAPAVVRQVISIDETVGMRTGDAITLFPAYLSAVERLARVLDSWT